MLAFNSNAGFKFECLKGRPTISAQARILPSKSPVVSMVADAPISQLLVTIPMQGAYGWLAEMVIEVGPLSNKMGTMLADAGKVAATVVAAAGDGVAPMQMLP